MKNPKNTICKGILYYNNGNYEAAIKEYQLAIEIEKKAEYYTNLGWSYYKLKEYTLAEENLNKAIQLDTKSGNAYRGLGLIYRDQLKNDEAEKFFLQAAMNFLEKSIYKGAIKDFTFAIELDYNDANLYDFRGWAYYFSEQYNEALKDFNKAIQLDSNLAQAYNGRASVYEKQGKFDEAKTNYLQAGKKYLSQKEYDSARRDFNNAIKIDENYGEAYYWLGQVESFQSNYQETINQYDKAISLGYISEWIYNNRGCAKYNLKLYEDAIEDFDINIEKYPAFPNSYRWRGESYYKLGEYEKAKPDFEKFLELEKNLEEKNKKEYEEKIEKCQKAIEDDSIISFSDLDISEIFGEVNKLLKVLLGVIAFGYVLIIARSVHEGTFTVGGALSDLLVKFILLLIVIAANALDDSEVIGVKIRNATMALILAYEVIDIVDNAKRLGFPVPNWLDELLTKIKEGIKSIFEKIFGGSRN